MAGPNQEQVPAGSLENIDKKNSPVDGLFDKLGKLKGQIIDEQTGELSADLQKTLEEGFKEFMENLTSFDLSKAFSDLTKRITNFLGVNFTGTDSEKNTPEVANQVEKVQKDVEAEKGAAVKPNEVFCFGDSLAVGAAAKGKYLRTEKSAQSGLSSAKLVGRIGEIAKAKNQGAQKIFITAGANDGVPQKANIQKIVKEATRVFGAKNVYLSDVPVYTKDPNYAASFQRNPNLEKGIIDYNQAIRSEFTREFGINIFHYETAGLLHPKNYSTIVADIDRELNVNRREIRIEAGKNVAT